MQKKFCSFENILYLCTRYIVGKLYLPYEIINKQFKYMKKILLLFAAAVCAVASWAADATVSATVKGQELTVALANDAQAFVAFQMDITLPAGVNVESDGAIVMNTDRLTLKPGVTPVAGATDANFIIAYNKINDTTVRVLAYNLENRALAGNEGALFTMTFTGSTSENFTVDGIKFVTETELAEISLDRAESVAGADFVRGDVTGEGDVDIFDINAIVDFILKNDTSAYNADAADVNGDTEIDIFDINAIVDIILGK